MGNQLVFTGSSKMLYDLGYVYDGIGWLTKALVSKKNKKDYIRIYVNPKTNNIFFDGNQKYKNLLLKELNGNYEETN